MNILGVQLILLFFAFFMLYITFTHWKKRQVGNSTMFVWLFIWLVFIFFTLVPKTLEPLLNELFFVRVMDIGMIGAFMVLTYISYENNVKIKQMEAMIEKLVRKLAVEKK